MKSGWYYDDQLSNVMTSVTLHSNMWWKKDENSITGEDSGEWVPWSEGGDSGLPVDDDSFVNLVGMSNKGTFYGYGIDPIARSILTDDFNVSIYNTWTDFGNDFISPIWDQIRQSGPFISNAINTLHEFTDNSDELNPNDGLGSRILKKAGELAGKVSNWVNIPDAVKYLNKALVSQGTRFSYYGGTGFAFGNLGMKFTVFPKYDGNKIVTVTEQMENFYPYVIGKLEPFDFEANINGEHYSARNALGPEYDGLLQWQSPPGGFKSELRNIDIIQQGTLKLKIGPHYCLTNLVCQEANFNFSKQMVKFPDKGDNNKIKISPLYCDVSLTLKPATLYSDIMMKRFVSGKGTYVDNKVNNVAKWRRMTEEDRDGYPADPMSCVNNENGEMILDNISIEYKGKTVNEQINDSLDHKKDKFKELYENYI